MSSNLPGFASSLTADIFANLMGVGLPVTSTTTINTILSEYLKGKAKEAHSILLEEIVQGQRLSSDVDPNAFAGLLFRYLTATRHGAARINLRLMAQLISGTLQEELPFKADALAHYSNILSQLTRSEIQLIATMWKVHLNVIARPNLSEDDKAIAVQKESMKLLIPKIFSTKDEYSSVATSTSRTGLILVRSVWGGSRFDLGPMVSDIVKLCSFEAVLQKEPTA